MKKILLAAAIAGVAAMSACTSPAQKAESEAADFKTKIENCTDPDSLKMYVDDAVAYANKLADEGKYDEAQDYLNDIAATVRTKAPETAAYFEKAKAAVDAITAADVDSMKTAAADSVKAKAAEAAEAAKEAAADKAKEVTDKAKDAADKAADKAGKAVNDAANKTADAVSNAGEAAKDKLNKALGN